MKGYTTTRVVSLCGLFLRENVFIEENAPSGTLRKQEGIYGKN